MIGRRIGSLMALIALLAILVAGCGGSEDTTAGAAATRSEATNEATTEARSTAYVAPANAACRQMLRDAKRVGRQFARQVANSPEPDLRGAATEALFRPGVRLIEASAARLRAIEAKHPDPRYAVYVGLYEPLVQLARLMLRSSETTDIGETRNLQVQMEGVGAEQRTAARLAGLRDCQVNFLDALIASWSHP